MEDFAKADKVLIQTIGSTVTKMTFFICCAIIAGMMINSCQVDEEVIKQCETSCSTNGNRMDSVSVFGCDCEQKQDSPTSPWVLTPTPAGD